MRVIGRVIVCALGVLAIRAGAHAPFWGDVALGVVGILLIGFAERDRLGA